MRRVWPWLMVLLWCGFIFYLTARPVFSGAHTEQVLVTTGSSLTGSSLSTGPTLKLVNTLVRKAAHLGVFGVLALLVWWAATPTVAAAARRPVVWRVGLAWLFATLYGATDEWHQHFVPGRTAMLRDVAIDSAGALGALLTILALRWLVRRPRQQIISIVLALLLAVSLAANGALGWSAYRIGKDYLALSRQFVRLRSQATAAAAPAAPTAPASAGTGAGASQPSAAAVASAPGQALPAAAASAPAAQGGAVTVADVRAQYQPRFAAVQADCEGQLSALLGAAKTEYSQAKAAGGKVDVGALGAKYFGRADALRRQCDSQVESLLGAMSADLKAAGLPTDLVADVRTAYQDAIVARQAEILAKVPAD